MNPEIENRWRPKLTPAYDVRMRHLAAAALVVAWIAIPVCAQRTSSHGGFSSHGSSSGHPAPAFHGSSRAPAPNRQAGARGYSAGRPSAVPRAFNGTGGFSARSPYTGSWRYRRPYRSPYQTGLSYAYPAYGFPGFGAPGYLAYPDALGDDDSSAPQNSAQPGNDQQPDDQGPPPWPYGSSQPAPSSVQPPPAAGEDAVTLIFKDGRPPEQIHNYILTRDTLYVGDKHHANIPVDQLDLNATVKVNQDAGVDFHLPGSPR